MNNKWEKVAFDQGQFGYSFQPELHIDPTPKKKHTGKEDLTVWKDKLEEGDLQRILKYDVNEDLSETVPLISSLVSEKWIGTGTNFIPGELILPHESNWECINGYLQLDNKGTMTALSKPIHFRVSEGMSVLLSQTISLNVYFEIPTKLEDVVLICLLKARNHFIGATVPVALGYLKLLESDGIIILIPLILISILVVRVSNNLLAAKFLLRLNQLQLLNYLIFSYVGRHQLPLLL